jgi:hypothetical protein
LDLHKFLEPEQVYKLRKLAGKLDLVLKAALEDDGKRFTYNKSGPRVAGINMIVAIISGSFGQLDLVRH